MIVLQSIGILLCLLLAVGFGLAIRPALRYDMHLIHRPGTCLECDNPEGES